MPNRHAIALPTFLALCVFLQVAHVSWSAEEPTYDLVVRNAKIVDGTGNPWFYGDVAIRGDRIVAVGIVPRGITKREIDAKGLVVAPGFIDIHSHSDTLLLEDGAAQSKIRQGVTTEVLGEGQSAGPYKAARTLVVNGTTLRWTTLGSYLDTLDQRGVSVNVASYVGLDNVWQSVMGTSFDRPTPAQLDQMKDILADAMKDGAFGLSSLLAMPPGSLPSTDEIVELCHVVAKHHGIFSSHIRNEGIGVFDSVKEIIQIGECETTSRHHPYQNCRPEKLGTYERGRGLDRQGSQARRQCAGQCLSLHARQ